MYEIHTRQKSTQIHPGQTLNLDYSVTHAIPFGRERRLQLGMVGYHQWQLTDKTGPTITPDQADAHYKVNALGVASNLNVTSKVNVGFKYFQEFANRSTFQGHSIQFSGSISF